MSGYKHEIIIINAFSSTVVQRLMSRKYDYNTEVVATGQDSNDVTLLVTVVLYVGRAQSEKAVFGN